LRAASVCPAEQHRHDIRPWKSRRGGDGTVPLGDRLRNGRAVVVFLFGSFDAAAGIAKKK